MLSENVFKEKKERDQDWDMTWIRFVSIEHDNSLWVMSNALASIETAKQMNLHR